ncbi:iron-containing alcohol dehydrogenase [Jannaschia aquimarina]|uniref:DhaT protein n=1 Tax=Jannaschia aquimarina TaxID=935700 RepID=A0A0D1D8J4_9RHOB|nr:iron-containing alcohol dehydrogenase [Jannaschia aquimarina]KIT16238.1 1,3-propanediol dehydrogenase [Jannaschia aquimarina]SNT15535.1 hypothetical protein SAMN05421775_106235 [Jannaschia aquimarina]
MSLITYVTRIHFAERVFEDALASEMARLRVSRPLLVTDEDGPTEDGRAMLEDALPSSATAIWDRTLAPPSDVGLAMWVETLAQAAREAECDVIVAFGGTSAMETGRRVAAVSAPGLPLVAVPTTTSDIGLGRPMQAGSTRTPAAAVPAAILCDPCLTYGTDAMRTAAHGFDALAHCIEAYLAPGYNPPADGIALEGIYRATHNLEEAVRDGRRPAPRREMMAAALNGALAAQKGLGATEAIALGLEAETGDALPHGRLHASVLPRILGFNAPAVGDRYRRIAVEMGHAPQADLIDVLAEFGLRIGLPDRIGYLGLDRAALGRVAARAAADPATQTNPRHATKADYLALLEDAV